MDPEEDRKFISIRKVDGVPVRGEIPHDYYGDVEEMYEKYNQDYIHGEAKKYYE